MFPVFKVLLLTGGIFYGLVGLKNQIKLDNLKETSVKQIAAKRAELDAAVARQ